MMFHTIVAVGDELNDYLTPFADNNEDIDVRETLGRFMTDIIGSCAYGIDCNSLKNPNSQFRVMGKQMISFSKVNCPFSIFLFFIFL
jgi:cytochrome P450 family 6